MQTLLSILQRSYRRMRLWARQRPWVMVVLYVPAVVLLIVLLPVLLPIAGLQSRLERKRKQSDAAGFACVRCGVLLGQAALDLADKQWLERVNRVRREHPGWRLRMVRDVDAVCTVCGARFRYDAKQRLFAWLRVRLEPADLIAEAEIGEDAAEPFFTASEIDSLLAAQPVREPLPFDAGSNDSIRAFYEPILQSVERTLHLRSRVEWNHYGSGYASFVAAWLYPADGSAGLKPFERGGERHLGLIVLFSRLSPFYVLLQGEQSWSATGGSGCLPAFDGVDDLTYRVMLPYIAPLDALLTAAGLQRLGKAELAAPLPPGTAVPTILNGDRLRQFDALFYWED